MRGSKKGQFWYQYESAVRRFGRNDESSRNDRIMVRLLVRIAAMGIEEGSQLSHVALVALPLDGWIGARRRGRQELIVRPWSLLLIAIDLAILSISRSLSALRLAEEAEEESSESSSLGRAGISIPWSHLEFSSHLLDQNDYVTTSPVRVSALRTHPSRPNHIVWYFR